MPLPQPTTDTRNEGTREHGRHIVPAVHVRSRPVRFHGVQSTDADVVLLHPFTNVHDFSCMVGGHGNHVIQTRLWSRLHQVIQTAAPQPPNALDRPVRQHTHSHVVATRDCADKDCVVHFIMFLDCELYVVDFKLYVVDSELS